MARTMLLFLDPKMRPKKVEGTFLLINNQVIATDELCDYCNDCFELLSFDEEYDACYCKPCNSWREAACQDPSCEYCDLRPKRPLR